MGNICLTPNVFKCSNNDQSGGEVIDLKATGVLGSFYSFRSFKLSTSQENSAFSSRLVTVAYQSPIYVEIIDMSMFNY